MLTLIDLREHFVRMVQAVTSAPKLTYAAVGVAVFVALLYFKLFFGDRDGFRQDVRNSAKSPILDPILGGDYDSVDSHWSNLKISIWILLSVGSGALAHHQLPGWFPNLFQ